MEDSFCAISAMSAECRRCGTFGVAEGAITILALNEIVGLNRILPYYVAIKCMPSKLLENVLFIHDSLCGSCLLQGDGSPSVQYKLSIAVTGPTLDPHTLCLPECNGCLIVVARPLRVVQCRADTKVACRRKTVIGRRTRGNGGVKPVHYEGCSFPPARFQRHVMTPPGLHVEIGAQQVAKISCLSGQRTSFSAAITKIGHRAKAVRWH
jgi:hypothetical protein